MFTDNKRLLIVGAGGTTLMLITAALLFLVVRSIVQNSGSQAEAAISDAMSEQGEAIYEEAITLPSGVAIRGSLQRGQTVSGSVGPYRMDGWSLNGKRGEQYLLDFEQIEGGYTWQMAVYDPQRDLLAFTADSESGFADFSQLRVDIPADGHYIVVLSGFGEGDGEYALVVY